MPLKVDPRVKGAAPLTTFEQYLVRAFLLSLNSQPDVDWLCYSRLLGSEDRAEVARNAFLRLAGEQGWHFGENPPHDPRPGASRSSPVLVSDEERPLDDSSSSDFARQELVSAALAPMDVSSDSNEVEVTDTSKKSPDSDIEEIDGRSFKKVDKGKGKAPSLDDHEQTKTQANRRNTDNSDEGDEGGLGNYISGGNDASGSMDFAMTLLPREHPCPDQATDQKGKDEAKVKRKLEIIEATPTRAPSKEAKVKKTPTDRVGRKGRKAKKEKTKGEATDEDDDVLADAQLQGELNDSLTKPLL